SSEQRILSDGRKAFAVQRCRPILPERSEMFWRSIALVPLPAILRIFLRRRDHHPVAIFLGQYGSRRNAGMNGITADDGLGLMVPCRQAVAIDQYIIRPLRQSI